MKYTYFALLLLFVPLVSCDPTSLMKINGEKSLTYDFECGSVNVKFRHSRGFFIIEQDYILNDTIWIQPKNLKLLNPTDKTKATVVSFFIDNKSTEIENFDGNPIPLIGNRKIYIDLKVVGVDGGTIAMAGKEVELQAKGYLICKDKPLDIPNVKFIYYER